MQLGEEHKVDDAISEIAALLATAYQRSRQAPARPDAVGGRCRQQKALITRGNRALMN